MVEPYHGHEDSAHEALADEQQGFYRVEEDASYEACKHCGHGTYWTIVSGTGEDVFACGISYGDKEAAEDICDLMNMAYDRGQESQIDNAEEAKLVEFFCSAEGDRLGRDGDHDNLSPAETAIRAIRCLERINMAACYASEENTEARAEALLLIGRLARGEVRP